MHVCGKYACMHYYVRKYAKMPYAYKNQNSSALRESLQILLSVSRPEGKGRRYNSRERDLCKTVISGLYVLDTTFSKILLDLL